MSRTVGSKNKKKSSVSGKTLELLSGDAPQVELTAGGQALWDQVLSEWKLDSSSRALLRLACESLSQAERCNVYVKRDGLIVMNRFDEPRKNEAAVMEAQFRSAAIGALNKLMASLDFQSMGKP